MTTVWQIASGESGRKYTDLFLQHDVMFCGPGRFGPFDEAIYRDVVDRGLFSGNKVGQVRNFAVRVRPGDRILLRSGYRVEAIGVVDAAGYQHNPTFDDVYGWDLQHTQRVVWQQQLTAELLNRQSEKELFSDRKMIPTFTRVNDRSILDPIRDLLDNVVERELKELPVPPPAPLTLEQLGEALFARGLSYDSVRSVRRTILKLRRLIDWYRQSGLADSRPTETEVVAHIVLPLMTALGWSEQLLAVEWRKIDLAVFWGTPTDADRCCIVCEAKVIGHGLQDVLDQATRYIETLDLTATGKILLTDGQRFYLYQREGDGWNQQPSGYLNLLKIREDHICPPGCNAVETLMALTPSHVSR